MDNIEITRFSYHKYNVRKLYLLLCNVFHSKIGTHLFDIPTPYNHKQNVLSASLNKIVPSFLFDMFITCQPNLKSKDKTITSIKKKPHKQPTTKTNISMHMTEMKGWLGQGHHYFHDTRPSAWSTGLSLHGARSF